MNTNHMGIEYASRQFAKRVMRRIYAIWFVKRALPRLAIETAALYVIVSKVSELIFVNRILANAALHTFSKSPTALGSYFMNAFLNAEFLVQTLLVASIAALFFATRDLIRAKNFMLTQEYLPARNSFPMTNVM